MWEGLNIDRFLLPWPAVPLRSYYISKCGFWNTSVEVSLCVTIGGRLLRNSTIPIAVKLLIWLHLIHAHYAYFSWGSFSDNRALSNIYIKSLDFVNSLSMCDYPLIYPSVLIFCFYDYPNNFSLFTALEKWCTELIWRQPNKSQASVKSTNCTS